MSKPLIIGNWKMNKTLAEAVNFVQQAGDELHHLDAVEVIIGPSFLALPVLEGLLRGTTVALAAQDVAAWKVGAYTGEVSASMLAGHCRYVIIGHSERRRHLGETPAMINDKIKRSVEAGLQPIVCISSQDELAALDEVKSQTPEWIVAYEPVASIGTGQADDPDDVSQFATSIRKSLGKSTRVIYGGSVEPQTVRRYTTITDGVLVGGSSLDPAKFLEICHQAAK